MEATQGPIAIYFSFMEESTQMCHNYQQIWQVYQPHPHSKLYYDHTAVQPYKPKMAGFIQYPLHSNTTLPLTLFSSNS